MQPAGILAYDAPPGGGVAALAMGDEAVAESSSGGPLGRRRRANAPAAERRTKRYTVKVSESEKADLERRATAAGVDVPRLMFESALSSRIETASERKAAIAEVFALRRAIGTIANNVNQLARYANTEGRFPGEAEAVVAEFRAIYPRLTEAVSRLADR